MPAPTMTFNAAGNILTSQALALSGTVTSAVMDFSTKFEGQLTIKNTPGAAIAATRGLKIECFAQYGTGPSTSLIAQILYQLQSLTASTAESTILFLPSGKWTVKLTNLDATNAVTIEVTSATIDTIA